MESCFLRRSDLGGRQCNHMQTYVANKEKEAAKKTAIEAAGNMLKTGKLSVEEVAACFTELSIEDVRHLKEEMMQAV